MQKNIIIRPANADDIDDMVLLLKELFSIEKDFNFDPEKHKRGLAMLIESDNNAIIVAQADKVIGMCSIQCVISTAQGTRSGWIEDVIVSNDYRQKGIATELLEFAGQWAKDNHVTRLQLLADTENVSAIDFYMNRGWHKTQLLCMRKFI